MIFAGSFIALCGYAYAGIALPAVPADKSTPVQQRISFQGLNAVSVGWNTFEQLAKPCVQYGAAANALKNKKCSSMSETYPSSRTWNNLVVLSGLKPGTTYYYKIVSTNSTTDYFTTARAAGDMTQFTMTTLADLGVFGTDGFTNNASGPSVSRRDISGAIPRSMINKRDIPYTQPALNHTTIAALAATVDSYDFVIHPGDLGYADDWIEDPTNYVDSASAYTAILETFYGQIAPVMGRKPYMVSPGNHEAACQEVANFNSPDPSAPVLPLPGSCPAGQSNFSDFSNRYHGMLPTAFPSKSTTKSAVTLRKKAQALAKPPFWYSFDYGMAHIVMFDTETDFEDAPDEGMGGYKLDGGPFGFENQQVQFLQADLGSVDRRITPWLIVAGHRPWYTNGPTSYACMECQVAFEDIFYEYGVDVGVFGHVHNLQRFLPTYRNVTDANGLNNPTYPMYTVIGGPGNIEGHDPITPVNNGNAFAFDSDYGYGSLTFYNATNLGVFFHDSVTGGILDSSMLYKKHMTPFVRNTVPSS